MKVAEEAKPPEIGSADSFRVKLEGLLQLVDLDGYSDEARTGLLDLMKSLYLAKDRRSVAVMAGAYANLCLQEDRIREAYQALQFGLHYFYSDTIPVEGLIEEILKLSGGMTRLMTERDVGLSTKLICLLGYAADILQDFPVKAFDGRRFLLGVLKRYIFAINRAAARPRCYVYWTACVNGASESMESSSLSGGRLIKGGKQPEKILITRAMGGIGDLLMLTPGIHALRKRYLRSEIHLAIPDAYFPLFRLNHDAVLLDIHEDKLDPNSYDLWFNLTDCPASRVETATLPRVRRSRMEIFAASVGIGLRELRRSGTSPRFAFSDEELDFQKDFFCERGLSGSTVVGVHLKCADRYRDYPHMEELVYFLLSLPQTAVLLFDGEPINGFEFPGVIKVDNLPLRKAFALASGCTVIIAPDSAFLHFAASQGVPTLGLFGPTDGKIRTRYYGCCEFVDSRHDLSCVPCWRHEHIPCKLTGQQESRCMRTISVEKIVKEIQRVVSGITYRV